MKAFSRVLVAMVATIAALFTSTGTSHAGLDNELSLVDGQDRTLTVQQWDTFLNGVFPLDRNRLTREWFHSGRAKYVRRGPGCRGLRGHAWSWVTRSASPGRWVWGSTSPTPTPNILLDDASIIAGPPFSPLELGHHPEPVPGCVDQR